MNKEISYSGYTAVPSDYESPDGALAAAINLIPDNGAIQPILPPKVVSDSVSESPGMAAFIHKTATFTHYIFYDNNLISYSGSLGGTPGLIVDNLTFPGVTHFNAVGNTLIAFSNSSINYFLWSGSEYKYLGDHIPDISISFGLIGRPRLYSQSEKTVDGITITFDGIPVADIHEEFSEDNKTKITEQIMAKVNKFVREQTVDKGRFCFPFFVRYALKLYDGSYVHHSAPILMNPSTTTVPAVAFKAGAGSNGKINMGLIDIMLVAASLDYQVIADTELSLLARWSDIVTGIDVFITPPIYTYDQEGKCTSFSDTDNYDTKFIGRLHAENGENGHQRNYTTPVEDCYVGYLSSDDFRRCHCEWSFSKIYSLYFSPDRTYYESCVHLPEFSPGKIAESLKNASHFYKLKSIPFSEIKNEAQRKEIIVEDEYLQSLLTREELNDDYLTHEKLIAEKSYVYNNRLNLSGVRKIPFCGFAPDSMFAYLSHGVNWLGTSGTVLNIEMQQLKTLMTAQVYIKENGQTYAVSASGFNGEFLSRQLTNRPGEYTRRSYGCYLFYPDTKAFKINISDGVNDYFIDLKPHEFLNGAYALLDYDLVRLRDLSAPPTTSFGSATYMSGLPVPNKVYTSEVNNPFYFPLLGINSVGSGSILGLCTAAKALSEGQFGQFPLYAFTTEGVWAMEVSPTGTYTARQPITRDVCINPDGITQIDSAVLFPTDRGIMLISGSQTQCISDSINSDTPFNILDLPGIQKLHASMGHELDSCIPVLPFGTFLKASRMIYDYVHQHIIVYNPEVRYAYVYSLRSQQWGMMHSDIIDSLNSYPEALAIDRFGRVVDFSKTDADLSLSPQLLVTRPLKFDNPDILKTVTNVIQRGHFRSGHVQSVLYGSRDLFSWHPVWSSRDHRMRGFSGSPYKYFRIALLCRLDTDESIFGASILFNPRFTNQPR